MAAGLAARPAAAAARLQGGDPALEGRALPAAEAAGPDRVPAPAARPAPALPAPPRAPAAAGGRLCPRAACPAGGHAPCQPHGGRVPVQRHGRGGHGHAAPLPAPPQHPRQVRAQRGCPGGAGPVQAPEPAAAVRVQEHPAGEPGAAGQGDAASAQGGAPGQPAGRLHRRHHPEPAGRGEPGPAALAGGVPGADGGSPVPAALADLLAAPARPRSPGGAPGAAHPAAAGRGRSRGASPGPRHCGPLTLGTGNQLLPWLWETGSPPGEGLEGHGRNPRGILQLHRAGSGSGGLARRVLWPPQSCRESWPFPCAPLGSSQRRSSCGQGSLGARDGPCRGDLGLFKPPALGMGLCCDSDPTPGSPSCPLKCLCGDAAPGPGFWGVGEGCSCPPRVGGEARAALGVRGSRAGGGRGKSQGGNAPGPAWRGDPGPPRGSAIPGIPVGWRFLGSPRDDDPETLRYPS